MKDTVYTTAKVYTLNGSTFIYLSKILGYVPGDTVRMTFSMKGQPEMKTLIKKVTKFGNSCGCLIDRSYGLKKGDIIVARIEEASGDDTGVEAEEGTEEAPE